MKTILTGVFIIISTIIFSQESIVIIDNGKIILKLNTAIELDATLENGEIKKVELISEKTLSESRQMFL